MVKKAVDWNCVENLILNWFTLQDSKVSGSLKSFLRMNRETGTSGLFVFNTQKSSIRNPFKKWSLMVVARTVSPESYKWACSLIGHHHRPEVEFYQSPTLGTNESAEVISEHGWGVVWRRMGAPSAALLLESLTALLPRRTLLLHDAESVKSSTPSKQQGYSRSGRG